MKISAQNEAWRAVSDKERLEHGDKGAVMELYILLGGSGGHALEEGRYVGMMGNLSSVLW
jgi:hypothetical protein